MTSLNNRSEQSSLEDWGLTFAADVHTVEERFLRAAWFDPARMHDVACDHGLTTDSFTDPVHRFAFAFVGLAVEHRLADRVTVGDCAAWARREGLSIDPAEWLDGILAERAACDGDVTDTLPELAALLASYVARRERARALLREVAGLLRNDPTDLRELAAPKQPPIHVAKRLRRRETRCA